MCERAQLKVDGGEKQIRQRVPQKISQQLSSHTLSEEEELVSFDVSSLYTNVPVTEAINVCADLLFSKWKLPVDKETFIILAKIASCDVIMSTHDGFYRQVD